jgi:hypothetical protein
MQTSASGRGGAIAPINFDYRVEPRRVRLSHARNPASVSSIIPSLWKTKSRPGSRTSRSIGEGAGTRDGAFGASLAGLKSSARLLYRSMC